MFACSPPWRWSSASDLVHFVFMGIERKAEEEEVGEREKRDSSMCSWVYTESVRQIRLHFFFGARLWVIFLLFS